jgi:hypothetical protein
MAVTGKPQDGSKISPESAMAGILALLIDEREERMRSDKDGVRTELLLARAGLSIEEIATVTGKKYDAVRMAIRRGKKTKDG